MKVQFRLVSKRWKQMRVNLNLDCRIRFRHVSFVTIISTTDISQIVQFIAPFFS